jgi:Zn-dependent protease with chaperone function
MPRQRLQGLESIVYEHPADRAALATFRAIPGAADLIAKFLDVVTVRRQELHLKANAIEITTRSLPSLHSVFREACDVLAVDAIPRLYVHLNGEGTYSMGAGEPVVVVAASIVDRLRPDELMFVLGHELGHIKAGHDRYHSLATFLGHGGATLSQATLGLSDLVGNVTLGPSFFAWCRRSELTADRAGYLACQDLKSVLRAMMKLAGAPSRLFREIDTRAFIEQARDYEEEIRRDHLQRLFALEDHLSLTHPYISSRILELIEWIEDGSAGAILEASADSRRAMARWVAQDPRMHELATACAKGLTDWAAGAFGVPRVTAGPIVRRLVFAREAPDGTPLESILRAELHVRKYRPDAVAYAVEVWVHRAGDVDAISVPIPVDPAWERIPADLRQEFIKTGKDLVVRLLYTARA